MTFTTKEHVGCLDGVATAEDAMDLAVWLVSTKNASIDLTTCTHLHGAVLQTLLAYRPIVDALPHDPFLAEWIMPNITRSGARS